MIRNFSLSVAALAAAVGVAFASHAGANDPGELGHGRPGGPGARLEHALESLDLDAAQRTELFGVIDAARPASRELREKMRAAHEELRALLGDASAGEDAVLAKAEAIGALRTELQKQELRTLLQVRARLSAEQQAQLAEAMSRKHCGRHERRHVL